MRTRMCEIIDDNMLFFLIFLFSYILFYEKEKEITYIFMFESQVCCTAARHPPIACPFYIIP